MKTIRLTVFIALICLYGITFVSCTKESPRPNIILMMADDLGYGDTGFNGNTVIKTPGMDALASAGIILGRFYSASPVCSPTRASCLTGRNPYRMGIPTANAGHLPSEELTLAELLKEQDYHTGHFGKWHLGTFTTKIKDANRGRPGAIDHVSIPSQHGFDVFFSTESKVPTADPMYKPKEFNTEKGESLRYGWVSRTDPGEKESYGTRYWTGLDLESTRPLDGDDSKIIMDEALEFIKSCLPDGKPFFTVIWFHTPHLPVVASSIDQRHYEDHQFQQQLYYASISNLDRQIGRLHQFLEVNQQFKNTLIFFCSDNGPEVNTPGSAGSFRGRKRDLYEGGIRVPAFVIWPDQLQAAAQLDFPGFTSDYLPTIVDFLGLDYPDSIVRDGCSLKPFLLGDEARRSQAMGFRFPGKQSWMSHEYKLISNNKGLSYELYNLLDDPGEQHNVYDSKPELAQTMRKELEQWLETF